MKPYSLKAFGEKLQAKGLPALENMAELTYAAFKEWVVESAEASETKLDDMGLPLLRFLDGVVVPEIDKIDKIEG